MKQLAFMLLLAGLSGCATVRESIPFLPKKAEKVGGVYRENLDPDRLVDLIIVQKLTGKKSFLFFNETGSYLEGYIRGVVVDYDDNPIEGIVVRVTDKGKDLPGFDPGISDSNGIYKIRFSQPIKKDKVDMRGAIAYNPPWQQQLDLLGATIEPQTKETNFRLFYDRDLGIIGIGEDVPKTLGRKVSGSLKDIQAKEDKKGSMKFPLALQFIQFNNGK